MPSHSSATRSVNLLYYIYFMLYFSSLLLYSEFLSTGTDLTLRFFSGSLGEGQLKVNIICSCRIYF
jgi:hypothetical protein